MFINRLRAGRAESARSVPIAPAFLVLACVFSVACKTTSVGSGIHAGPLTARGALRISAVVVPARARIGAPKRSDREALPSDLEKLVSMALESSPAVRSARARFEAAVERAPQVGSLPDPKLRGRYFLEEVETRVGPQEWALALEQYFPALGLRESLRRHADARAEAEAAQLAAVTLEVAREVKLAWFELYYLEQSTQTLREDRDRLRSLEAVIRRNYAAGSAPYTDLIRAQVELGRAENRLAGLTDQRKPAGARLNAVLHRQVDAPVPTPTELGDLGLLLPSSELARRMEVSSPQLAVLRHRIRAAEQSVVSADLERRSGFSLGLEYIETGGALGAGVAGSGDDPLIATLSIELPVRRARYDAASREARARSRALNLDLEAAFDRLRSKLEHEHFLARDAERQVVLYQETLSPRARQAFDATETAFRGGQASFLDLIDAERVLLEFKLSLQRARTDRALAHARLEALVGEPVSAAPMTPTNSTDLDSEERPR